MLGSVNRDKNKKGNKRFWRSLKYHNDYIARYNKSADKLSTLSSLSQIRVELVHLIGELESDINELVKRIKSFVSVDENAEWEIEKLSKIVGLNLNHTFPYTKYSSTYEVNQDELLSDVKKFSEAKEKFLTAHTRNDIVRAYQRKERIENLLIHKDALESLIDKIFDNNLPEKLEEFTEEEFKEKNQGGRPKVIPDEIIEVAVLDMLDKAEKKLDGYRKLIHRTPKREGQAHYSEIARKLFSEGIVKEDDIDIKTLRDKVSLIAKEKWK